MLAGGVVSVAEGVVAPAQPDNTDKSTTNKPIKILLFISFILPLSNSYNPPALALQVVGSG